MLFADFLEKNNTFLIGFSFLGEGGIVIIDETLQLVGISVHVLCAHDERRVFVDRDSLLLHDDFCCKITLNCRQNKIIGR
ncbi:hypothetical protein DWX90_07750 [Segatella copri]|uniref:Uncharacterized protein n=1 Tax=Segatella copri TaxID=165179 RepID=A0AA93BCW7_9BACT|nr:hypothetical protein DWX90_07750 [Segatella copri]